MPRLTVERAMQTMLTIGAPGCGHDKIEFTKQATSIGLLEDM
jgi:hypothetical protein